MQEALKRHENQMHQQNENRLQERVKMQKDLEHARLQSAEKGLIRLKKHKEIAT